MSKLRPSFLCLTRLRLTCPSLICPSLICLCLICFSYLCWTELALAKPAIALQKMVTPVLKQPTDMRPLGQGWLVSEQEGVVRRIKFGSTTSQVVLDYRKRIKSGGEQGLLSLVLHPQFASNGWLFLYGSRNSPRRTELLRIKLNPRTLKPQNLPQILLEISQPYSNHNGGQLAFGPDGNLYLSLGDGGAGGDPHNHAQNKQTLLGTILRLDISPQTTKQGKQGKQRKQSKQKTLKGYTIPPDNPFLKTPSARPEIWAFGLRNPWRISFDSKNGNLWSADVGQNRLEEINLIERGGNYGWASMEGTDCYRPPKNCQKATLKLPVAQYPHGPDASITGGYVYRGKQVPALVGQYLFIDYISGRIRAIPATSGPHNPLLLLKTQLHVSSFAQDQQGELYLLAHQQGQVWKIVKPSGKKK